MVRGQSHFHCRPTEATGSGAGLSPNQWSELVALAEREYELAESGRWEEVAELSGERLRRSLALGQAPASARPALERLARVQSQIDVALQLAHASAAQELAGIRRGRTAVRGYGASLAPSPSRVDSLR